MPPGGTYRFLSYLIAVLPFIFMVYKKFRYLCLPVLLTPFSPVSLLKEVFPSVCLGSAFSYENRFEKLGNRKLINKLIAFLVSLVLLYLAYVLLLFADMLSPYTLAFVIPYMVYGVISYIPIVSHCLKLLRRHSMNFFLTHIFIYTFILILFFLSIILGPYFRFC